MAVASVTTGFRCARLNGAEQNATTNTATPQPPMITTQPAVFPFVRANTTLATTPLPKSTSGVVPRNSAKNGDAAHLPRGQEVLSDFRVIGELCSLPGFVMPELLREFTRDVRGDGERRLRIEKE